MKKSILAIYAAPAAIPKKPNIPAIIAITKKITVQRSICVDFSYEITLFLLFTVPKK
jgi:hypothetical protein